MKHKIHLIDSLVCSESPILRFDDDTLLDANVQSVYICSGDVLSSTDDIIEMSRLT